MDIIQKVDLTFDTAKMARDFADALAHLPFISTFVYINGNKVTLKILGESE